MGVGYLTQYQIDALKQMGFQVEWRDNILLLKYPKHLIEAEIFKQISLAIPPEMRNKVRVRAEGDIIVEVML